jgi:hypothetical protein
MYLQEIEECTLEQEFATLMQLLNDYEKRYQICLYQEAVGDERMEYRQTDKNGKKENIGKSILMFIIRLINNIIYRIRSLFKKDKSNDKEDRQHIESKPEISEVEKFINEHHDGKTVELFKSNNHIKTIVIDNPTRIQSTYDRFTKARMTHTIFKSGNVKMSCNIDFERMDNWINYFNGIISRFDTYLDTDTTDWDEIKEICDEFNKRKNQMKQNDFDLNHFTLDQDKEYSDLFELTNHITHIPTYLRKYARVNSNINKKLKNINADKLNNDVMSDMCKIIKFNSSLMNDLTILYSETSQSMLELHYIMFHFDRQQSNTPLGENVDHSEKKNIKKHEFEIQESRSNKQLNALVYLYARTIKHDFLTSGLICPKQFYIPGKGKVAVTLHSIGKGHDQFESISDRHNSLIKSVINFNDEYIAMCYYGFNNTLFSKIKNPEKKKNTILYHLYADEADRPRFYTPLALFIKRTDLVKNKIPEYLSDQYLAELLYNLLTNEVGEKIEIPISKDEHQRRHYTNDRIPYSVGNDTIVKDISIPIKEHEIQLSSELNKQDSEILDVIYGRKEATEPIITKGTFRWGFYGE